METIRVLKDWQIIHIDGVYMIQHIPSKEYLGGKSVLTANKNINSKKLWKLDTLEEANKKLEFVADKELFWKRELNS